MQKRKNQGERKEKLKDGKEVEKKRIHENGEGDGGRRRKAGIKGRNEVKKIEGEEKDLR